MLGNNLTSCQKKLGNFLKIKEIMTDFKNSFKGYLNKNACGPIG